MRAKRVRNIRPRPLLAENHAYFCINEALATVFLGCINEQMNGVSSRAHFVMCLLVVRPCHDGEGAILGATPFLCHCMLGFLWGCASTQHTRGSYATAIDTRSRIECQRLYLAKHTCIADMLPSLQGARLGESAGSKPELWTVTG